MAAVPGVDPPLQQDRPHVLIPWGPLIFGWFVLVNLLSVLLAKSTDAADALLVLSVGAVVIRRPRLFLTPPPYGKGAFYSFHALLALSVLNLLRGPVVQGIRHLVGLVVAGVLFLFFRSLAPRLLGSRLPVAIAGAMAGISTLLLLGDIAGRNVVSSTAAYYILAAGVLLVGRNPDEWARFAIPTFALVTSIGLFSGHRTMIIIGLAGAIGVVGLRVRPRASTQVGLFAMAVLGIVLLIMINTGSPLLPIDAINDASIEITGRTFQSGRQRLWPATLVFIGERPFFGWGTGAVISDFVLTRLSSHNYYLQLALQLGYVGLGAAIMLLSSIWNSARLRADSVRTGARAFASACVVVVAVHSCLDVFLTQNQLVVAAPVWMLLGLATGMVDIDVAAEEA